LIRPVYQSRSRRLPYHHQGILHYVNRLGVALEPFTQVNFNAYVPFDGNPMAASPSAIARCRPISTVIVAELLGKAPSKARWINRWTKEDREILMMALQNWGALDANYQYVKGLTSANRRGYDLDSRRRTEFGSIPSEPSPCMMC
jgi:monoamine oxidase